MRKSREGQKTNTKRNNTNTKQNKKLDLYGAADLSLHSSTKRMKLRNTHRLKPNVSAHDGASRDIKFMESVVLDIKWQI